MSSAALRETICYNRREVAPDLADSAVERRFPREQVENSVASHVGYTSLWAMTPEEGGRVRELFHAALDLPAADRARFLENSCRDPRLRVEVESLLSSTAVSDLLQNPALEGAREVLQQAAVSTTASGTYVPAPRRTAQQLEPGSLLGPYKIQSIIGAGGMGQVYSAVDTRLNRNVAVKVLSPEMARDTGRMARFVRESKALASLNHLNIVAIYDVGENFIVTELISGGSLRGASFSIRKTLDIIAQVASGLAAAHAAGIIHRDIKPENILLTSDARAKIVDFGVALQTMETVPLEILVTQPGLIVGTAAYMSPEQIQGRRVDHRSDIFSLGLVMYELLSGQRSYGQSSPIAVMNAIVHEPAPELPETIPLAVRQVVNRCLEKDPLQRFQSAADLAFGLQTLLSAGSSTSAGRPIVPRPAARRLWLLAGCGAVAVSLSAVALLTYSRKPAPGAPLMRFVLTLPGAADIHQGVTPAISPDGTKMVFPSIREDGEQQLMAQRMDQAAATPISGSVGAFDAFFSPRGDSLGFFTDGYLKRVSGPGEAVLTIYQASSPRGATWSENGDIIAALNYMSGLVRFSAVGGTAEPITTPKDYGEVTHRWPQVLPGGGAVLFTAHTNTTSFETARIKVVSLRDKKVKEIYSGGYFGRYLPTGHLVFVHQDKLMAAPFDVKRLVLKAPPQVLLDDVAGDISSGHGQFAFSHTGLFVYHASGSLAGRQLVWLDASGTTEPLTPFPGNYFNPRISPDGKRILLQLRNASGGDIALFDIQTRVTTQLTFDGAQNQYGHAVWAPDGKHIVCAYTPNGRFGMAWLRADMPGSTRPILTSDHYLYPSSFTPDGKLLAYSELNDQTNYDVLLLPLDTSDPDHPKPGNAQPLLKTEAAEEDPVISPDGRWLAYASTESGGLEVYVRKFPLTSGKWLISAGGGVYPLWSRNSKVLFYQNNQNRIMVLNYESGADSFAPGSARLWAGEQLAGSSSYAHAPENIDVAPDGKRFAVFSAEYERANSLPLVVLVNFFDEVVRRLRP